MAAIEHGLMGRVPDGFAMHIDGCMEVPGARIEVHSYQWCKSQDVTFTVDSPYIDLALSPRSPGTEATILRPTRLQTERVGRLIFSPPGYQFHSRWNTGRLRSVSCTLDIAKFLTEGPSDIRELQLGASLDVRNLFLEEAMRLLGREAMNPGLGSDILAQSVSSAIAVELQRHFRQSSTFFKDGCKLRMNRDLLRFVENSVHDCAGADINLTDIAREYRISVGHLSRMFFQAKGVTLACYVTRVRIQKAKTALADGVTPIKKIAHNCGFRTVSAFSAAFRRETGVTPGAYRRVVTH